MRSSRKTKKELLAELDNLRARLAELESAKADESAEALKESEERYRLHFENVADVIYITDRELRIRSVSPSVEGLIGYRPDEIVGRRIDELNVLAPECHEQAIRNTLKVLAGEKSGPSEYTFLLKDGTKKIGEVSGAPLLKGGEVVGVISVARDITARKKAEAELQSYRDHLEEMVAARTAELTGMNEKLQRQIAECTQMETALAREAEINASVAELSKALIRQSTISEISTLVLDCAKRLTDSMFGYAGYIETEAGVLVCPTMTREVWQMCQVPDKDVIFKKFGGLWGWVLSNKKPILTNSVPDDPRSTGLPQGHIAIHRFLSVPALIEGNLVGQLAVANSAYDYSEQDLALLERLGNLFAIAIQRERGEEELRRSEARYRHLSETLEETVKQKVAELRQTESLAAIGRMVSVMAHEVRNPLQSIHMGFEEIKKIGATDKRMAEVLDEINYGIELLNGIITELLDYSRPVRLNLQPACIRDIVTKTLTLLDDKLKNVTVQLEVPEEAPNVYLDPDLIARVFLNIISNAIDAMEGNGHLAIFSEFPDERQNDDRVRIEVIDNGRGLRGEDLARAFEPFFTTKTFGTGLGMPICKKIIEAHNGSLTLTSEVNEGTKVEIMLPLRPPT